MTTEPSPSSDRDDRIEEVIAAYSEAKERGDPGRAEDWIARHPDLADDLASFFGGEGLIAPLADGLADRSTVPAGPDSGAGTASFGGYVVIAEVGRGGMGVVYEARHRELGRVVALKMMTGTAEPGSVALARFRNEAGAIARLDHRGIVPIYEVGESDGRPFFAMKYLPEGNLSSLHGDRRASPRLAAGLVLQAAEAIHHAHLRGILHRDLKPSNILLESDRETVVVSDFGLAKSLDEASDLTSTDAVLGSPSYMAPEQADGRSRDVTVATDVYGLGAVLYSLLADRPPFRGPSPLATLDLVRSKPPTSPRLHNPGVDRDLETICLKCLEKEPGRRYGSAADLAADLGRWLEGRSIRARRAGAVVRSLKWARRNPAPTALIVVTLASLIGVGWLWRSAVRANRDLGVAVDALETSNTTLGRTNDDLTARFYEARISLVDRELEGGDAAHSESLLEECPPSLRGWEWNYLRRKRPVLAARSDEPRLVPGLAWDRDGRRLASLASSQSRSTLTLLDVGRQAEVWSRRVGPNGLGALAIRPDGGRIATVSVVEGTIKQWDTETGDLLWTRTPTPLASLWSVAYSPDGRTLLVGGDKRIDVFRSDDAASLATIDGHTERVYTLAFRPTDGGEFVSSSDDGTARVWDLGTRTPRLILGGNHLLPIKAIAYSPDGRRLVAGTESGDLIAWDASTGEELAHVHGHGQLIRKVAFHPDGTRLATAADDRSIKIWDATRYRELLTIRGSGGVIFGLAFDPEGSILASSDLTVRYWDASPIGPVPEGQGEVLRGHEGLVTDVAYSRDGSMLASCSHDATVIVRDAETGAIRSTLAGPEGALLCLAFRPDGRHLVAAGWGGVVGVWNLASGRFEASGRLHDRPISRLAFSPDGRFLATAGADSKSLLLDAKTGKPLAGWGFGRPIADLAFDPDSRRVALVGLDTIQLLQADFKATPPPDLKMAVQRLDGVAFSPDGRRVAACGASDVTVWEVATGTVAYRLPGIESPVLSVAYSPDGRWLATGGGDRMVTLWDAATGLPARTFIDAGGPVVRLAFRPDGRRLAATGGDLTVRVWNLDPPQGRPARSSAPGEASGKIAR